jgi:hypothetical protein
MLVWFSVQWILAIKAFGMISNIVSRYCGRLVFICDMYQTASFDNKVQTFSDLPFAQAFEFEFRTTHCLWVSAALELKKNELSLRSDFWVPLIFFFAITKRGQYRLWTYLTSLLKRGRESLLQKSGEEVEDKGHFERKNWVERRLFYLICAPFKLNFF